MPNQSGSAGSSNETFFFLILWSLTTVLILVYAITTALTTLQLQERVEALDNKTNRSTPLKMLARNWDFVILAASMSFVALLYAFPDTREMLLTIPILQWVGGLLIVGLVVWAVVRRTALKSRYGPNASNYNK